MIKARREYPTGQVFQSTSHTLDFIRGRVLQRGNGSKYVNGEGRLDNEKCHPAFGGGSCLWQMQP